MRGIDSRFIHDLIVGSLAPFLAKVKESDALSLEIRQNYINIYYRGGNALRIRQNKQGYRFEFDEKYCLDEATRASVKRFETPDDYRNHFALLLAEMDNWFRCHPKPERELQHELVRLNRSDFCILDIEYAGRYEANGVTKQFRFDMIAVCEGKLVVVENKYGMGAMGGKAGIAAHYSDICAVIDHEEAKCALLGSMKNIAENKKLLGLPFADISGEEIEILFLLLQHNERSKMLKNQWSGIRKTHPAKMIFMGSAEKIHYEMAELLI